MHIITTHASPDWDAIGSVWMLKRFLPGWENAKVEFVPAGDRNPRISSKKEQANKDIVVLVNEIQLIHVDTGLTPLDHHQLYDTSISSVSRCFDYVLLENPNFHATTSDTKREDKIAALTRMVTYLVSLDHFQEVFWENPASDIHEFSIYGILEGMKSLHPNQDDLYVEWGMEILDALLHRFESKIWAEKELEKGKEFTTKWGKAIAIETINDSVIKLAQKIGYVLVVRKDPRYGFVRIKAVPYKKGKTQNIDLTLANEQLHKMDPEATWFLHVSKKMLLNGTPKNPKMIATKLSLEQIVRVLEKV